MIGPFRGPPPTGSQSNHTYEGMPTPFFGASFPSSMRHGNPTPAQEEQWILPSVHDLENSNTCVLDGVFAVISAVCLIGPCPTERPIALTASSHNYLIFADAWLVA